MPQTVTYTVTRSTSGYGAGTNYTLTDSSAEVDRGTTDSAIVFDHAGTYKIDGQIVLFYNGATFASPQSITIKMRRTNNTPGDVSNSTVVLASFVLVTFTGSISVSLPGVVYVTDTVGDRVAIFAEVEEVPSAGTLEISGDSLIAQEIL